MKLFGINIGKAKESEDGSKPEQNGSIKKSLKLYGDKLSKHQAFAIILLVVAVLALTSLQMLRFTDPPVDDVRAQENISQLKRIKLDDNVAQQIKNLQDSNASASPSINTGRTNPFSE